MIPSSKELQFSSSVAKLLHHRDKIVHPLYPVTLQVVPTDSCNLNCDFCSVKHRGHNQLPLEVILGVVDRLDTLQGVEITGGGDPTMYPGINELIIYLGLRRLDIGMITNGVALMRKVDTLDHLTWLRVSLNCLDYVGDIELRIPGHITLGFSYVLNDRTTQATIDKVKSYSDRHGAEYVRIVPDCVDLSVSRSFDLDHPTFYAQTKTRRSLTPIAPCRMGYLKPYLNSDGYFYWCSGVCLERRYFPEEYRMGHYSEIDEIWGSQRPFECHFSKCFWVEHNDLLELANQSIVHGAFL